MTEVEVRRGIIVVTGLAGGGGGNVVVTSGVVAILYQNYAYGPIISTGYVGANSGIISTPISIANYRTKTIQGWAKFNGVLKIYTSYAPGQTHPYPYYATTISSGTTFTASFSEAFYEVKVEIDNTSSTTGLAFVGLGAGVL
jgi:hypothetical protein